MKWAVRRNGVDRTFLRVGILAIAVALLLILGYRQIRRMGGASAEVWAAATDLAPGTLVEPDHLGRLRIRERDLPAGLVRDRAAIEGRQLAKPKAAGKPFLRDDFAPPDLGPGLAGILPKGRVLVFVPLSGLPMADLAEQLRFGDRFDLVAIGGRVTTSEAAAYAGRARPVAHDAFFVGWVAPRGPAEPSQGGAGVGGLLEQVLTAQTPPASGGQAASPLLLALHPEDVVPLAEAQAAGAPMALVLHGRKEVEAGELLVLPRPRLNEVELIRGANRVRIPLSQPRTE